ncbi:DUF1697 domain-containing protein [Candidatus Kaiserbacteria bacterium]|nr:DUF1697 domain-containing protein [Candidatus Kaiserbacteria bacterium]
MNTYVALLRGINVGGNKKVSMAELRELFSNLGFSNVRTYINSGNVLFDGKQVSMKAIEMAIKQRFGFAVPTLVVPVSSLRAVVKATPEMWHNDQLQKVDVLFLWPPYNTKTVLKTMPLVAGVDETLFVAETVVWRVERTKQNKSYMQKGFIGSEVYRHMTARNINTVRKLVSLVGE